MTLNRSVILVSAFLMGLILLLVGVNWLTLKRLADIFEDYRKTASLSQELHQDLNNFLLGKTASLKYRSRSDVSAELNVSQGILAFTGNPATLEILKDDPDGQSELQNLHLDAGVFLEAFRDLTVLQRETLEVSRAMQDSSQAIHGEFVSLTLSLIDGGEEDLASIASQLQTSYAHAALLASTLILEKSPQRIDDIRQAFDRVEAGLDEISWRIEYRENLDRARLIERGLQVHREAVESGYALLLSQLDIEEGALDVLGPSITRALEDMVRRISEKQNALGPSGALALATARAVVAAVALLALALGAVASIAHVRRVSREIGDLTRSLSAIARGDLSVEVPGHYRGRKDALGGLADALVTFRENAEAAQDVARYRAQQKQLEMYARSLEIEKRKAERAAGIDGLTGLANRRAFDNRMAELENDPEGDQIVSLLHIDLDKFKNINDTLGHAAGDYVLIHVADVLRVGAARAPFISRIGGDEFVVLFDEPHDPTHPHEIAEELVNKLAEPIEFEGRPCRFGASIGIAQAAASEASGLLVQADLALYEAKDGGRGQVSTFSPQLQLALLENRALADEVEMALGDERIVPYFQPILDVETGALVALEALARWRHPERGVLDPPAFLSASEEFGLLGAIDREILSRSVAFFQELASTGLPLPRLAVNVDCTRIHDDALMAGAVSALGAGIPISFELKETVVLEGENDQTRWSIDALREKGVSIEIDDFGSGRASIVALQKVAPDGLKIDQELVLPIVNSEAQRRLVASILDIGRTLSIRVTAEGVETAQHHAILTDMGCHVQQGYFFAEPMTPEATLDFVRRVSAESKGARRA